MNFSDTIRIVLLLTLLISVIDSRIHSKKKKKARLQNKENGGDGPIINTENGRVQGTKNQTIDSQLTYYAFKGIPFAKPPLNELRFEPPQPVDKWEGIRLAANDSIKCIQSATVPTPGTPLNGQEDCLYLNVYTPNLPSTNDNESSHEELLPVMVYLFGGAFRDGNTSSISYGPDFLIDKNVVVVAVNYRLGILGFISTGDLAAPGNVGLKDQNFALKWVQANIRNFGGDPNKVTIFGESAGSVSVSLHIQSPKSKGLFRSAVMQSGTSLCPWSLSLRVSEVAFRVGHVLGASTASSKAMIEDLKKVDLQELQNSATTIEITEFLLGGVLDGLVFGPVIEPEHEDAFFSNKSHQQLSDGGFNRVPVIVGLNSQEGNFFFGTTALPVQVYFGTFNLNTSKLVPADMNVDRIVRKYKLGDKIKEKYFGSLSLIGLNAERSTVFLSDHQFNKPIDETVSQLSKYVDVYYYVFRYIGLLGAVQKRSAPGVQHAEEQNYIWYRSYRDYAAKDWEVRRKFVEMLTNFAKVSNPTPKENESLDNVIWPKARQNDSLAFLAIDYNLTVSKNPFEKNLDFWYDLYKKYGNPPYTTY